MKLKEIINIIKNDQLKEQNNSVDDVEFNDNFWKWFGDSKIVDNSGKPLVVYHGSRSDFDEFEGDVYFTDDYMNADGYAGGEYIYEVYISIKNPLIVDAKDRKWDEIEDEGDIISTQDIVGMVDRSKYDGVVFINIKDSWIDDVDYQDPSTVYVAFKSNQIKSTDNDGSWDVNDKNIYS